MIDIRTLMARFPRPGRIEAIILRPARRADVVEVAVARVLPDGLEGDHASEGLRAVTLIQAEHLTVIASLAGCIVTPPLLRRNLVVSGINLAALRGATLTVGGARLHVTGPCPPCSRMEAALGPGGYNAMRGHGGWYAEVIEPGTLSFGDAVALSPQ